MSSLFSPITIGSVTARNRAWMSPMCQYSAAPAGEEMGRPTDWHDVHYASRGWGGVGAVIVEATAVTPEGRISPFDLSLHSDDSIPSFARLAKLIRSTGAVPGIQLGHAGRKASGPRPWDEARLVYPSSSEIGWEPVAPSAIGFSDMYMEPRELSDGEITALIESFAQATRRAVEAGFEIIELHGAHGYLIHQFLSPLSNTRTDRWGGDSRAAFPLAVLEAMRKETPGALAIRVSATDWCEFVDDRAGWTVADTVSFVREAKDLGLDFVDVSSGGNVPDVRIPAGPGYQVRFARDLAQTGVPTGTVGLITEAVQAEQIVRESADVVLLGRSLLSDPYLLQAWRTRLREEPAMAQPYHRQLTRY
ncbi:NADH:flavin oxidoreductase/NADH oxidase [Flaviflexus equikiangi]|uniref:NADH:flavin oxidoreductase/NADH oxidase n=1 Tax=Flaviflexus equikiangi TaxID=2758573 RepID=UPI0015F354E2|nr:NADH:flavin oxidoreductase/NADH oxidase [Flaviflexus equikiangi]